MTKVNFNYCQSNKPIFYTFSGLKEIKNTLAPWQLVFNIQILCYRVFIDFSGANKCPQNKSTLDVFNVAYITGYIV